MSVLPVGFGSAVAGGYQIERSLRFNSADSAYLNRNPASSSNQQKWTWSGWIKRGSLGGTQNLFGASNASTNNQTVLRLSSDTLQLFSNLSGVTGISTTSNAVYRDSSAWYHIVCSVDTTQATSTNRVILYVNGSAITFNSPTYPTQNYSTIVNATGNAHEIGRSPASQSDYFNGYMTEINFIDGQALTPSSFGQTNASTGVWEPINYTGTYGTNGFELSFADNSGTTSTTLGADTSGNGNNWTPNNFSVTAGVGNDSLVDSPTSYGTDTGAGGTVRGNYCTWNPLKNSTTLSDGNLRTFNSSTTQWLGVVGTFGMTSGKWYWEYTPTVAATVIVGLANSSYSTGGHPGSDANSWGYYSANGNKYFNNSGSAYGATYTANDVIGVAFDADAGTLTFYKNGISQGTAYSSLTSGPYFPAVGVLNSQILFINAGQRAFAYTAPSGFKALCTQNLPTPTIGATSTTQANDYFDVSLWTGTGVAQSITNSGSMQPDFVWTKTRSLANDHFLFDAIRGVNNYLRTNSTGAEATVAGNLTAFNSNGFSVGTNNDVNASGRTFVGWQWKGANGTVSNTSGTITSTVSASTTSGFSIVTYTGNGTSGATVGHGLGVTPGMIIIKARTAAYNWAVWHTSLGGGNSALQLNSTNGTTTAFNYWNSTNPSSTVFTLGNDAGVNTNTNFQVAYCFAPVAGYSAFGSFTGNGSTDGPFVFTNMRPRYLLIKLTSAAGEPWTIADTARSPNNVSDDGLYASSSSAESANDPNANIDILSNGFKLRCAAGNLNTNGATYIYMAFAENPFKYSLAR